MSKSRFRLGPAVVSEFIDARFLGLTPAHLSDSSLRFSVMVDLHKDDLVTDASGATVLSLLLLSTPLEISFQPATSTPSFPVFLHTVSQNSTFGLLSLHPDFLTSAAQLAEDTFKNGYFFFEVGSEWAPSVARFGGATDAAGSKSSLRVFTHAIINSEPWARQGDPCPVWVAKRPDRGTPALRTWRIGGGAGDRACRPGCTLSHKQLRRRSSPDLPVRIRLSVCSRLTHRLDP